MCPRKSATRRMFQNQVGAGCYYVMGCPLAYAHDNVCMVRNYSVPHMEYGSVNQMKSEREI
jgi:hypothetical protein